MKLRWNYISGQIKRPGFLGNYTDNFHLLSYFPPTSPYAGETMRETVRLLFFSHHPLCRRTHERRRVFRGFLAMAAHVRCLSPTHTHTRNVGSPRNNTKRTRCVTHLLIVIDVIVIQGRRVGNCKLSWAPPLCRFVVGKLPHSHHLCSKCVGGEEEARKKLRRSPLTARPLLLLLQALSSHTPLMQQVCRKREGRGSG